MKEKYVEQKLRDEVRKLGGIAYKFESPGNNGVPDRIVILPTGLLFFVELKRPKGGRLSKLQIYQHNKLRNLGIRVYIIKNTQEVAEFIDMCKMQIRHRFKHPPEILVG